MNQTYIIIDDDQESVLNTQAIAGRFRSLIFVAFATTYDDGVNLILEHQPNLVFLEIDPTNKESNLSLYLINELYRYLKVVPKIIITTKGKELAYDALQYEVIDYLLKPLNTNAFRKSILKLDRASNFNLVNSIPDEVVAPFEVLDETKNSETILVTTDSAIPEEPQVSLQEEVKLEEIITNQPETGQSEIESLDAIAVSQPVQVAENPTVFQKEQSLIICVKSYGDYRYIDSTDVLYFEADNNSTDIHLSNGEMVTAFKTLKHFETVLPSAQFLRIHNSYIINIAQVSRIHTGNTVCYIKNSATKLPFSKSYKENVDLIINRIASGNYLEI
jgi:DNA-binding LytR/AlgR family response regulator